MGTVSSCRIFALPLLPVALQSAVECTYPIPEELSATCLILFGNIVGIVYIQHTKFAGVEALQNFF